MKTWEQLQSEALERHKDNIGLGMSDSKTKGAKVLGGLINKWLKKGSTCLDVGCGLLPKPYYMEVGCNVVWYGIDPFNMEVKRDFFFKKAMAEDIPYPDEVFDGVCFATTLNHVKYLDKSISEVNRVLQKGGYLFVWTSVGDEKLIQAWKDKGGLWNYLHAWGFSEKDILSLFIFEKIDIIDVRPNEKIYIFKK